MKKILIISVSLFLITPLFAQKLIAKNGHVRFYSHTPVEDIEADNNQSVSILNTEDNTIQFSLLVKSFEFEKKLMQEHFNENYMESDTYPKASFSGKLTKFDNLNYKKDGSYPVEVTGDLTIHGVTQNVTVQGVITVSGTSVKAVATFIVKPEDYKIIVPDLVKDNIAKEIEINVDVIYMLN